MKSGQAAPPMVAERILALILPREMREPFLGDLAEEFHREHAVRGAAAARRWYWWQTRRAPVARPHRAQAEGNTHHITEMD